MMKTIERMAARLQEARRRKAERRKAELELRHVMEARRAVRVTELRGEVYLSVDGVPVLPVDGLRWDLPTALDVAREAYAEHRKEELRHGLG